MYATTNRISTAAPTVDRPIQPVPPRLALAIWAAASIGAWVLFVGALGALGAF